LEIVNEYNSGLPIRLIPSLVNNGFAGGNNIGIQKALDEGCELVFILNPDIQLNRKCIDILIQRIMTDEKIGIIGPIILLGDEPGNITQACGVKANFRTQKKSDLFGGIKLSDAIPSEIEADYVLGGAMMIKSEVLKITGLFEEDYFMYNDELDLAYRVKKAGYKTICLRDAIVKHFHNFNAQNKKGNNLMYYYMIRNKYLYFKKHHLYYNLILSLFGEFIKLPVTFNWASRRMRNIKLLKYYYSGILDGLLGKRGISTKSFN
jgi:GT2 family glycosyltransferase